MSVKEICVAGYADSLEETKNILRYFSLLQEENKLLWEHAPAIIQNIRGQIAFLARISNKEIQRAYSFVSGRLESLDRNPNNEVGEIRTALVQIQMILEDSVLFDARYAIWNNKH